MINLEAERERLAAVLGERFAHNALRADEYERLLEYAYKIETPAEITLLDNLLRESTIVRSAEAAPVDDPPLPSPREKRVSLFSWRTSNLRAVQGSGGSYTSVFGVNRILVDSLPPGRTVLRVNAVFGLTEIIVPASVKVTAAVSPVFSGVFVSDALNPRRAGSNADDRPELYLTGRAVFGSITVKTTGERSEETRLEKEFEKVYAEKIRKKMLE